MELKMSRTLQPHEYIWVVTGASNDGGRQPLAYFSDLESAEKFASRQFLREVHQTTLYFDGADYFKVKMERVEVDKEKIREQALSKLSEQEKRALNL